MTTSSQGGKNTKSRTLNKFYALMMHTLTTGGNLNCGTDGGLKTNQGTFGLVASVEDKLVCVAWWMETLIPPAPNARNFLAMQHY